MLRRRSKKLLLPRGVVTVIENFLARDGNRSALLEHGDKLILHIRWEEFSLHDLGKLLRKARIHRLQFLIARCTDGCSIGSGERCDEQHQWPQKRSARAG